MQHLLVLVVPDGVVLQLDLQGVPLASFRERAFWALATGSVLASSASQGRGFHDARPPPRGAVTGASFTGMLCAFPEDFILKNDVSLPRSLDSGSGSRSTMPRCASTAATACLAAAPPLLCTSGSTMCRVSSTAPPLAAPPLLLRPLLVWALPVASWGLEPPSPAALPTALPAAAAAGGPAARGLFSSTVPVLPKCDGRFRAKGFSGWEGVDSEGATEGSLGGVTEFLLPGVSVLAQ
mmetsp:Transcript_67688/g.218655  ORF Transcript_67688/g.218655 Transcript_67688/m.218655 type:complete len:237 (+) Transcript_67688:83-793(+)